MKKVLLVSIFFNVFLTFTFCQKNFIDQPYIEVSGYADTLITPNEIYLKIIISEKDTRDKIPVEDQEIKMIAALKSIGINTEVDLTSSDMLSNYKFYLLKSKEVLKSKEYILKVGDAATASTVFIQLEDLEISNTSIQRVDHTNLEDFKNYCRVKAVENAQKKANALLKPLNQNIGNAIYITDVEDLENYKYGNLLGSAVGINIRGNRSDLKQKYEAPKIEFQKIKVTARVGVKFLLK
jgi:uncharacterized protein